MINPRSGFNKIDSIVIIAIILVSTIVFWTALSSARAKARDHKRLNDVQAIQEALKLYYNDNFDYPSVSGIGQAARPDESACREDKTRFRCYLPDYPAYPRPIDGKMCLNYTGYAYSRPAISAGGYSLTFCLGSETEGLAAGPHRATASGIQ